MYKFINNSKLPKLLKWLINILLTITCVYWLGYLVYLLLDSIRKFIHWTTEPHNWWTFLMCVMIVLVGSLIVAQFALGLDPIGKATIYITEKINSLRESIANLIMS